MKKHTTNSMKLLDKDTLFYFPTSYEKRRTLQKNFFRQNYIYVFQIQIHSFKTIGNKIFINASVFDRKITVVHSSKLKRFFTCKTKYICGSLKYHEKDDIFDEKYDPTKGDEYEEKTPSEFYNECKWNRGWSQKNLPKIFCFFPEIFDLRLGIIAKYSKLKPLEVKNLKSHIENHAPNSIQKYLMEIHEPTSLINLNQALRRLLEIEIACFIQNMNEKVENEAMPYNPDINLPFQLSDSQKSAIEEIYRELSDSCRMSRVLYGDVGSGKTIIAILSALKCIVNGKNVLYLVPNQLLVSQVKENFQRFTPQINTIIITSNLKKLPIYDGNFVYIGTHALLWKEFENIGLVIVDEQHKFGVEQRHTLTKNNNLLMMTATMIPRTFQMILFGNLTFSQLETRQDKAEIKTFITSSSEWHKVLEEVIPIAQFYKVIWVSSSIEDAEKNYNLSQTQDVNTFLIHGRIKEKDLILRSFDQSEGGILFSTTVIEVGIDIDVKCIVIENADHFGLAQLHQIRGRVGRRSEEGICILIGKDIEKLDAIQEAKTGFEISKMDLKIRGFGILQSSKQSGFKSFIFAKYWDKKWRPFPINEEVISISKSIPMISSEVCNLFLKPYEKMKI